MGEPISPNLRSVRIIFVTIVFDLVSRVASPSTQLERASAATRIPVSSKVAP